MGGLAGQAWHSHLGPHDHNADIHIAMGDLHRQIGYACRLGDAAHGLNGALAIFGQA